MNILYESTRGDKKHVSSAEAILSGIAPDGGLYVPAEDMKDIVAGILGI